MGRRRGGGGGRGGRGGGILGILVGIPLLLWFFSDRFIGAWRGFCERREKRKKDEAS